MSIRSLIVLLFCSLCGCERTIVLHQPFFETAEAALLAVESNDLEVWAIDLSDEPFQLAIEEEGDLDFTVLLYDTRTLTDLVLEPGVVNLVRSDEIGAPLPRPDRVFVSRVQEDTASNWELTEELSLAIQEARIQTVSTLECAARGGCLLQHEPNELSLCKLPCPALSPLEDPAPPEPPRFAPCPSGWAEVVEDGVTFCAPPDRLSCTDGAETHFLREASCRAPGDACPIGEWSEGLSGTVLYVDDDAPANGDGSQGAPFAMISAALAAATPFTTIALAKGQYNTSVVLPFDVALIGACARSTVIAPQSDQTAVLFAAGSSLRNVTLLGGQRSSSMASTGTATVDGVSMTDADEGVVVSAGSLQLQDVFLRGADALVATGGSIQFSGVVEATASVGRVDGATLRLEDTVLIGSSSCTGLVARNDASLSLTNVLLEQTDGGILVAGALADLSQVILRDLQSATRVGLQVGEQGVVTGARVRIDGAARVGVFARDATLTLQDLLVRDTQVVGPAALDSGGGAFFEDAQIEILRSQFHRNRRVTTNLRGGEARLTDLLVADTQSDENGKHGWGAAIDSKATVEIQRGLFARSRGYGVYVYGEETSLAATDLVVEDTNTKMDGTLGRGFEVRNGAFASVSRGRFVRNHSIAVNAIRNHASAELSEIHVAETREADDCVGFSCSVGVADGVGVIEYARITMDRFIVENNGLYGVRAIDSSEMILSNGLIANNVVGAYVAISEPDLGHFLNRVRYEGNPSAITVLE